MWKSYKNQLSLKSDWKLSSFVNQFLHRQLQWCFLRQSYCVASIVFWFCFVHGHLNKDNKLLLLKTIKQQQKVTGDVKVKSVCVLVLWDKIYDHGGYCYVLCVYVCSTIDLCEVPIFARTSFIFSTVLIYFNNKLFGCYFLVILFFAFCFLFVWVFIFLLYQSMYRLKIKNTVCVWKAFVCVCMYVSAFVFFVCVFFRSSWLNMRNGQNYVPPEINMEL